MCTFLWNKIIKSYIPIIITKSHQIIKVRKAILLIIQNTFIKCPTIFYIGITCICVKFI